MSKEQKKEAAPWYKDGLRFQCTECGKCCTGPSGFVWVSIEEMTAMAAALDITLDAFKKQYTRRLQKGYALTERKNEKGEYDCVFLKGKLCTVYQARPIQCRTFPWWEENLKSKECWDYAANDCEGINDQAPVVPYSQIVQLLRSNKTKEKND